MNLIWKALAGAAGGAAFGYGMYRLIGCRTGACPLYASPWLAMALWALMGVVIATGGR